MWRQCIQRAMLSKVNFSTSFNKMSNNILGFSLPEEMRRKSNISSNLAAATNSRRRRFTKKEYQSLSRKAEVFGKKAMILRTSTSGRYRTETIDIRRYNKSFSGKKLFQQWWCQQVKSRPTQHSVFSESEMGYQSQILG